MRFFSAPGHFSPFGTFSLSLVSLGTLSSIPLLLCVRRISYRQALPRGAFSALPACSGCFLSLIIKFLQAPAATRRLRDADLKLRHGATILLFLQSANTGRNSNFNFLVAFAFSCRQINNAPLYRRCIFIFSAPLKFYLCVCCCTRNFISSDERTIVRRHGRRDIAPFCL